MPVKLRQSSNFRQKVQTGCEKRCCLCTLGFYKLKIFFNWYIDLKTSGSNVLKKKVSVDRFPVSMSVSKNLLINSGHKITVPFFFLK